MKRDDYRRDVDEGIDLGIYTTRKTVPWLILFFIILGTVDFVVRMASRPAQVMERATDPDPMIQTREWFKNTHETITRSLPAQIEQAQVTLTVFKQEAGPRIGWTYQDKVEFTQLRDRVEGLKLYRQQLMADYNAKARTETSAFLAWGLPKEVQ